MVAAEMKLVSEVMSEEAVRRELWISFGSLVRAYLAAAQMGVDPPQAMVVQLTGSELELVGPERIVRLSFDADKGDGYWAIYKEAAAGDDPLAEGAFRIGMDSLVEWTGLPVRQQMDAVAEALATLVIGSVLEYQSFLKQWNESAAG